MKKLLLVTLTLMTGIVFGQENTVKLRIGSFLVNTGYLEYERAISDKGSVTFGVHRTFPTKLTFDGFVEQDTEEAAQFGDPKLSGYGFTFEYRAYTSGSKDPQQGFYVAPFLRHSSYKIAQGAFVEEDDGTRISAEAAVKLNNTIGLGVAIGTQWVINDKFSIDVTWIGLGVSRSNVSVEYSTNDTGVDFREAQNDLNEEFAGESWVADIETTQNSAKVTSNSFLLPIIRGNISVGYRF